MGRSPSRPEETVRVGWALPRAGEGPGPPVPICFAPKAVGKPCSCLVLVKTPVSSGGGQSLQHGRGWLRPSSSQHLTAVSWSVWTSGHTGCVPRQVLGDPSNPIIGPQLLRPEVGGSVLIPGPLHRPGWLGRVLPVLVTHPLPSLLCPGVCPHACWPMLGWTLILQWEVGAEAQGHGGTGKDGWGTQIGTQPSPCWCQVPRWC